MLFLFISCCFSQFMLKLKMQDLKLALTIPTGAPITVENDAIGMLPVVTDITISDLSK